MTNLDSILKSRGTTLLRKVCLVKAMVFPGAMYGCENWTITKAKHWRRCFQTMLVKTLETLPWTTRRSNQSILKEINPEYSLEGQMLKPKLQYYGRLMWGANSLEKILMLGNIEGWKRRGQQDEMIGCRHWLNGHESEQTPGDWEGLGNLACFSPWDHRVGHDLKTEQQQ